MAIQVNETLPHELLFDVYFLDYGDSQFISKKDILELRADFLSLRFQAIECFLAHIQPANNGSNLDEWDEKAVEKFEDLVKVAQWKKLISKVVAYKERKSFAFQRQTKQRESSPIPGVELYDPEDQVERNISLELVKMGYADMPSPFGDLSKSAILNTAKEDFVTPANESLSTDETEVGKAREFELEPFAVPAEAKSSIEDDETNDHSVSKTNGDAGNKSSAEPSSLFAGEKPPKSSKKQQLTDFLQSEQKATSKKSGKKVKKDVDWNVLMEESLP